MCCIERLIRMDSLSASITTTRRLFAYSLCLLRNVDPGKSLGGQDTRRSSSYGWPAEHPHSKGARNGLGVAQFLRLFRY